MNFSEQSLDLIFSNWLLMYLSDKEVENLAERMIKWLKVGGCIFFRESCFHQSGDHKRKNNSPHYPEPRFYTKVFKECHLYDNSGNLFELALIGCKCIGAYVKNKENQNQKISSDTDRGFQKFLDAVQYKCSGILRYDRVFGHGFVSTGGIDSTKEFVSRLDLQPGQKVLDVGCGIGGGDFDVADDYDVHVVVVEFEVADCATKQYPDGSFDVIYSHDTILHIQDKPALFQSFYKWLKPGGKVLISDYRRSAGSPSTEFSQYIKQRDMIYMILKLLTRCFGMLALMRLLLRTELIKCSLISSFFISHEFSFFKCYQ